MTLLLRSGHRKSVDGDVNVIYCYGCHRAGGIGRMRCFLDGIVHDESSSSEVLDVWSHDLHATLTLSCTRHSPFWGAYKYSTLHRSM